MTFCLEDRYGLSRTIEISIRQEFALRMFRWDWCVPISEARWRRWASGAVRFAWLVPQGVLIISAAFEELEKEDRSAHPTPGRSDGATR